MKVGLQLVSFTWPGGAKEIARRLAEIARTAEEAGFHSLWVMDHYFQIPPWGRPEDHPMLEAYSTLGYLAAATARIRLGVLVSGVVYRPPAVLIKAATTVDVLSGGRTYFGVGAAWFKGEADALGIAFPALRERYALLEDTLRLARQTWAGDTAPFEGKRVRAAYPLSNPRPLSSPRPKILVGGDGPKRTSRSWRSTRTRGTSSRARRASTSIAIASRRSAIASADHSTRSRSRPSIPRISAARRSRVTSGRRAGRWSA